MIFMELKDLEAKEMFPGGVVRFVHSPHMTLAYWNFKAGVELPRHRHPHEQVTSVIHGELELTVGGETRRLVPGAVAVIPPDTEHEARPITECYVIDTFYPVREDFR
jgi:quercetin dioxygenase-like cupin family protein